MPETHICNDTPPEEDNQMIPSFLGLPPSPTPFCCWGAWLEDREILWELIVNGL